MIVYKDIFGKLKRAGYTTYRIRKEHLLSESVLTAIRKNETVSLDTLDTICELTGLPVEELIEHRATL